MSSLSGSVTAFIKKRGSYYTYYRGSTTTGSDKTVTLNDMTLQGTIRCALSFKENDPEQMLNIGIYGQLAGTLYVMKEDDARLQLRDVLKDDDAQLWLVESPPTRKRNAKLEGLECKVTKLSYKPKGIP